MSSDTNTDEQIGLIKGKPVRQKIYVVYYSTTSNNRINDMGFVSKKRAEEYRNQKVQDDRNVLPSFARLYSIDTLIVDCYYNTNEGPVFVYD